MTCFWVRVRRMEQLPDNTWVCVEEKQVQIHTTMVTEMLRITLAKAFGNWRPNTMWAVLATKKAQKIKSNEYHDNAKDILTAMYKEQTEGETNCLDCYPDST